MPIRAMPLRTSLLATVLVLVAAYAAYPYVTLLRLGWAIHTGDTATLEALVDWPSVREGISEDMADLVIDTPASAAQASNKLPPFGASFMHGIASNMIAARVSPATLVSSGQLWVEPVAADGTLAKLHWAFFDTPNQFTVSFQAPGEDHPITLRLRLRDGAWRVMRAWLPADLLTRAKSRT
jgi:hypothetical protein